MQVLLFYVQVSGNFKNLNVFIGIAVRKNK